MCLALYLFTDNHLDDVSFDPSDPAPHVRQLKEYEREVTAWVPGKLNIYYIGSSEQCGCGWRPAYEYDEEDELAAKTEDREWLFRLLSAQDFSGAHLISCWEGDQGEEPDRSEVVDISTIRDLHFEFVEGTDYLIS